MKQVTKPTNAESGKALDTLTSIVDRGKGADLGRCREGVGARCSAAAHTGSCRAHRL